MACRSFPIYLSFGEHGILPLAPYLRRAAEVLGASRWRLLPSVFWLDSSDAFLKGVYERNPWRTTPPVTEFYNIERLELLDNEFFNTTIVIHPSVKTVVVRGDISRLVVESAGTRVIRMPSGA